MTEQNPIDTVLAAEKNAQAEIAQKRSEAHQTVNQALAQARAISERTTRRITKIHTQCAENVKRKCEAMWQDYEREPLPLLDKALTPERLTEVVDNVAAKLTGGRDE